MENKWEIASKEADRAVDRYSKVLEIVIEGNPGLTSKKDYTLDDIKKTMRLFFEAGFIAGFQYPKEV